MVVLPAAPAILKPTGTTNERQAGRRGKDVKFQGPPSNQSGVHYTQRSGGHAATVLEHARHANIKERIKPDMYQYRPGSSTAANEIFNVNNKRTDVIKSKPNQIRRAMVRDLNHFHTFNKVKAEYSQASRASNSRAESAAGRSDTGSKVTGNRRDSSGRKAKKGMLMDLNKDIMKQRTLEMNGKQMKPK